MLIASPWHFLLAVLRLPRMSWSSKALCSFFHTTQATAAVLVLVASLSPDSRALGFVARGLADISWPRADVDIGPAAWYVAFIASLVWVGALTTGMLWVHLQGSSIVKYVCGEPQRLHRRCGMIPYWTMLVGAGANGNLHSFTTKRRFPADGTWQLTRKPPRTQQLP